MSAVELVRLSLHVTAATVWVGGQLTLAALVPALRSVSAETPGVAARAFARVAWPAFGVLVLTGLWNVQAEQDELHGSHAVVFGVKMVAVVLGGDRVPAPDRDRAAATGALRGGYGGVRPGRAGARHRPDGVAGRALPSPILRP